MGVPIDYKIKRKSWWMRVTNANAYVAWFGQLRVPSKRDVYILEAAKTDPSMIPQRATLVHEGVHIYRQKKIGKWLWNWKYLWRKKTFRYTEELIAYKAEIRYLESKGRRVSLEYYAGKLSGSMYGHAVSHADALKDLEAWRTSGARVDFISVSSG